MFSNRKLYSLKKDQYDEGNIDLTKLVANVIDIDFLSHLILFPDTDCIFPFDKIAYYDLNQLSKYSSNIIRELKGMKLQVIIGFQSKVGQYGHFTESDLAISSKMNMYEVLELIHICQ